MASTPRCDPVVAHRRQTLRSAKLPSGICLLAWVAILLIAGCASRSAPDPILIGHLAPQSGPEEAAGASARNGILLAVEDANAAPRQVLGRPVAVLHADSRGDFGVLRAEAIRLIAANRVVALYGGDTSEEVDLLAREVLPTYALALVTPTGWTPDQAPPKVFAIGLSGPEQGRALARFATDELKPERIAVLSDGRNSVCTALAAAFRAQFHAPVAEWTYRARSDLPGLAGKLVAQRAEAVVLACEPRDLAAVHDALTGARLPATVPLLIGGDGPIRRPLPEFAQPAYGATAFAPAEELPRLKAFVQRYTERFGRPPDEHAMLGYDGVHWLCEALRRAGAAQSAKVRDELARWKTFDGLPGQLTLGKDHTVRRPVFITRRTAGQGQPARRYDGSAE